MGGDKMSDAEAGIPFGQDFTPAMLGKQLGEANVLPWLLQAASSGTRAGFASAVESTCLSSVPNSKSRRDMASHVVSAMRAYKLIATGKDGDISLTPTGQRLKDASDADREALFAQHIITMCGGQRFVDAIRRYELRGESPDLEDLSIELGEHATSKNISTLRAWLGRAGVVTPTGPYRVNEGALDRLLGGGVASLYGLEQSVLEFLLAARIIQQQKGTGPLDAVDVADLAESRGADTRIRRKSLGQFVKKLEPGGFVRIVPALAGKGGSRTAFELVEKAIYISEEQIKGLLTQSQAGFPLSELLPLTEVIARLGHGTAYEIGRTGEQLAVHLCLMLGLHVRNWRKRAPHSEIDLIAERLSSLSYQRWIIQVKNTDVKLDADQVDREIGTTAGLGVSHILFVVPRAEATLPALGQMRIKNRLTHLHIYSLTAELLLEKQTAKLLAHLQKQAKDIASDKRQESEHRERSYLSMDSQS